MDHVPSPAGVTELQEYEVLHLVKPEHEFEDQDFEQFPAIKDFVLSRNEGEKEVCLKPIEPDKFVSFEEVASFFQSWLYFGLLRSTAKALILPTSCQELIQENVDGIKVVSSQVLPEMIWRFASFELDNPEEKALFNARRAGLLTLQANLATAQAIVSAAQTRGNKVFTNMHLESAQWEIANKLLMSVYCLLELLHGVLRINHVPAMVPFRTNAWLEMKLAKTGWCQNAIALKTHMLRSPASMIYLSKLAPPYLDGHEGCTQQKCQRSNIRASSYVRQHSENCDQTTCVDVIFEDEPENTERARHISGVVERGHIPVVTADLRNADRFQVMSSSEVPCYVAISHVWSDGLGNASRNSIYSCQLGRIQHYVNNLFTNDDGPIPFWLDTICVPKERESRRQAILDMKDVYAGATKVLVLDKLLFTTPVETSVHEKLMRITASVWTTRLWTLQESILGKEMPYQFSDKAFTFNELWAQAQDTVAAPSASPTERTVKMLLDPILAHGLYAVRRLSYFQDIFKLPEDEKLAHIHPALSQRATSWIQDEAICLTTLIGQDISTRKAILESEDERRMLVLFQNMKVVHAGILFTQKSRYEEDGCRWIPKSLLWDPTGTAGPFFMKYGSAKVSPDGLIVRLPTIRFRHGFKEDSRQQDLLTFEHNNIIWNVGLANDPGSDPVSFPSYAQADFALITGDNLTSDTLSHVGALVTVNKDFASVTTNVNSPIYARWEVNVVIAAANIWVTDYAFLLQEGFEVITADQGWCIG